MKKLLLFLLLMLSISCRPAAAVLPTATATNPPTQANPVGTESTATTQEVSDSISPAQAASINSTEPTKETSEAETSLKPPASAATDIDHADLLRQLLLHVRSREDGQAILAQVQASGDTRFVAGLIDVLRYQRGLTPEITATLADLTGARDVAPDWLDWVEWAGQRPEYTSFDDYDRWKSGLLALIDPSFLRFVYPEVKVAPDSRIEEIVWGGVRVDGIPALDNPKMIEPDEATYLGPNERVFGVTINGDARAYPARFLDWHEMFNDIVGGEPVSLAY